MLHNVKWNKQLVKDIIAQAFPKKQVLDIEQCTEGFMNVVLDVTLVDRHVIVKLSDQIKEFSIEKEAWLFELVRKHGIPVPEIYFKDFSKKQFPYEVLVVEKLRGKSLDSIWSTLTQEQQRVVCFELGKIFATIHSIRFHKPGRIAGRRIISQPDFATELKRLATGNLKIARKMRFIPATVLDHAEMLLLKQPHWSQEYCLSHMDFHFKHVFVDGTQITGILDWGFSHASIPAHDFFKPDRWIFDKGAHAKSAFIKGYETIHKLPPDFEEQVKFLRIYSDIKFVERLVRTGEQETAARYVKIIEGNIVRAKKWLKVKD